MPACSNFCGYGADYRAPKVPKVGKPKRDKSRNKAQRQARRKSR